MLVPVTLNGHTHLVSMDTNGTPRDFARAGEENARKAACAKRRKYYGGEQYRQANLDQMSAMNLDPLTARLPEHLRLHAYSTQIRECVDFLSAQIANGFTMTATDTTVRTVLDTVIKQSPRLVAYDEDGQQVLTVDELTRDAIKAGDVAVEIRWNPVLGFAHLDLWESECVEFRWLSTSLLDEVIRTEVVWVVDEQGRDRQVVERARYRMAVGPAGMTEARKQVFWDEEEAPRVEEWLGLPFLPWALIGAGVDGLRSVRGASLITDQAMESADRYNANEQVAWLIARYNSHGNVVVVGDAASLKIEQDGRMDKDVADVLKFPGGTNVQSIQLPTDPEMIEHQRMVLEDALYETFGLVRIKPDTAGSFSGISGYALEILNRQTDSTFSRLCRTIRRDFIALMNMVLDASAYWAAPLMVVDTETLALSPLPEAENVAFMPNEQVVRAWWQVQPNLVYPNRKIQVSMGSGYIVDDVMIRDDFVAKLISLEEALRQRGLSEARIKKIVEELDAQAEKAAPEIGEFTALTAAGATLNGTGGQQAATEVTA